VKLKNVPRLLKYNLGLTGFVKWKLQEIHLSKYIRALIDFSVIRGFRRASISLSGTTEVKRVVELIF
jgi:hypothetical protein